MGRLNLWRPMSDDYARQLLAAGTARNADFLRFYLWRRKSG